MDEQVPYLPTERARLLGAEARIADLEKMLRHFDRSSMHLLHYTRSLDWPPTWEQWQLVCDQVADMVNPYGSRNPNG